MSGVELAIMPSYEEYQKGRDSIKDEKDWNPEEEIKRHFKLKR